MSGVSLTDVLAVVGWIVVVATLAIGVTQRAGRSVHRVVSIVQTLTPHLLILSLAVVVLAVVDGRVALAVVGTGAVLRLLVVAAPLARRGRSRGHGGSAAADLRILHANLLFRNDAGASVATALDDVDADVLTFSEYTPAHAAAFHANGLTARYPHRVERADAGPGGVAVWSSAPIRRRDTPDGSLPWLDLELEPAGRDPVRLVVVHTATPVFDHADWLRDLDAIGELVVDDGLATVVVGDLNATWWHPPFRRLLARARLRSAHVATGRGWTTSWPLGRAVPPFARLDHALVDDHLDVAAVTDVHVPGSDHRGLVVSVRRAAPAAP